MLRKMNNIFKYCVIALLLIIAWLSYSVDRIKDERDRYKSNQTTLMSRVEFYQTENGKSVASVQRLMLTFDELKENYDSVCRTADELRIKVKRLQSVSNTATKSEVIFKTVVRDSMVYVKGDPVDLSVFDWRDPWTDVSGIIDRDSVELHIQSCDTLVQMVHRVPHKWWFIKWGTKAIRQEVMSRNPHTKMVYSEYLELK